MAFVVGEGAVGEQLQQAQVRLVLGAAVFGYSTMLTFSGDGFPNRFGAGEFRDSYRAAFAQPHDTANVNPHVLRMLQRHDPAHARP
jgi:hypothetical protein